jgi:hypothetical protein
MLDHAQGISEEALKLPMIPVRFEEIIRIGSFS